MHKSQLEGAADLGRCGEPSCRCEYQIKGDERRCPEPRPSFCSSAELSACHACRHLFTSAEYGTFEQAQYEDPAILTSFASHAKPSTPFVQNPICYKMKVHLSPLFTSCVEAWEKVRTRTEHAIRANFILRCFLTVIFAWEPSARLQAAPKPCLDARPFSRPTMV